VQPPQPPYGGSSGPGFGPPGGPPGSSGPPGSPGWEPPPGQPKPKNGAALVIVVVIVAFVLLIGGVLGLAFLYGADDPKKPKAALPSGGRPGTLTPSAYDPPAYSPPPVPSDTPADSPSDVPDSPSEEPSTAATVFDPQPGQCVKNTGTASKPRLYISTCAKGHYKILNRIDGTTNIKRCDKTDYTYAVWFTDPKYVLCLREV
jgi:hypothetical protein